LKVLRLGDREVEVDPWGSCHYRDEESRICRVSIRNRGVSRMLWGDE
jgi:hypothetical protein